MYIFNKNFFTNDFLYSLLGAVLFIFFTGLIFDYLFKKPNFNNLNIQSNNISVQEKDWEHFDNIIDSYDEFFLKKSNLENNFIHAQDLSDILNKPYDLTDYFRYYQLLNQEITYNYGNINDDITNISHANRVKFIQELYNKSTNLYDQLVLLKNIDIPLLPKLNENDLNIKINYLAENTQEFTYSNSFSIELFPNFYLLQSSYKRINEKFFIYPQITLNEFLSYYQGNDDIYFNNELVGKKVIKDNYTLIFLYIPQCTCVIFFNDHLIGAMSVYGFYNAPDMWLYNPIYNYIDYYEIIERNHNINLNNNLYLINNTPLKKKLIFHKKKREYQNEFINLFSFQNKYFIYQLNNINLYITYNNFLIN